MGGQTAYGHVTANGRFPRRLVYFQVANMATLAAVITATVLLEEHDDGHSFQRPPSIRRGSRALWFRAPRRRIGRRRPGLSPVCRVASVESAAGRGPVR